MLKTDVAAVESVWVRIKRLRVSDVNCLAPLFRERVLAVEKAAQNEPTLEIKRAGKLIGIPFHPVVFETCRPDELQRIYYEQGTTKAKTALFGWHFYGLAVDMIDREKEWSVPDEYWEKLAKLGERFNLDPGRRWKKKLANGTLVPKPDNPHLQFGTLKASPSDAARALYFGRQDWQGRPVLEGEEHKAGLVRVWKAVGAI